MWDLLIVNPMINALLWFYGALGNNIFLSIAVLTILLRLATVPSQIQQQRTAQKMQALQPQVKAIQKKYKDNQQKQLEELQKIGADPRQQLAGCLPLLIQMPILIGFYRAILIVLGATPQSLLELTARVYPFVDLSTRLPIANKVAWLNLAQPDPYLIMPVLVLVTSFISQRVLSPTNNQKAEDNNKKKADNDDNPMAEVTKSMQYTMPLMFGFLSLQFPAGLSIYWVLQSLIGFFISLYARRQIKDSLDLPIPQTDRTELIQETSEDVVDTNMLTVSQNDAELPDQKSKPKQRKKNRSKKR